MVRDLSADKEFGEAVIKEIAERTIIDHLMAFRTRLHLSQKDIADKMKCTQSRISKLESGTDDNLRLGDLASYGKAMGFNLEITFTPENWTITDEIKYHAISIKSLLDQLAEQAKKDHSIAKETAKFLVEARVNLARIVHDATTTVLSALNTFGAKVHSLPIIRRAILVQQKHVEPDCDLAATSTTLPPQGATVC